MSLALEKNQLRRHMRAWLRDWQDSPARAAAQAALLEHVAAQLAEQPEWRTLAVFAPLPDEPELRDLLAIFPERRWAFPRVSSATELEWFLARHPQHDFEQGAFHIPEPRQTLPRISPTEFDAWLCPALAFSPTGDRLGRGKGFYDRALAEKSPAAVLLGIAWHGQILPNLPHETHDQTMHAVLTEAGIFPKNFKQTSS